MRVAISGKDQGEFPNFAIACYEVHAYVEVVFP
jgi:hypothetical protein